MRSTKDAPVDRGCLVGVIFFILGLGTLLPWNFFMTATKYFQGRLNKTEWINGTGGVQKEYYFNGWMTLLSQLPLLLFTFLNSFLYQWISEKVRIGGTLVFIFLLFVLTAILVKIPMEEDNFFSITMATIWFINSFGAVLQGSLFGLVGLLPQRYSSLFMSGQGMAGTFAALAMLLAIASEADAKNAALGYFITPCVGSLITLLSYMLLSRLEFAQFYFDKSKNYKVENNNKLLIMGTETGHLENGKLNGQTNGSVQNENGTVAKADLEMNGNATKQTNLSLEQAESQNKKSSVKQVFKKIWVMAFCVTFVFTVTLSVFPTITVDVRTMYGGTWERYFITVCCFLTYNVMDWIGRSVTSVVQWPPKESRLFPALVVARVIFIPLFMLCNVQERRYLPIFFRQDGVFALIMALFSVSNGYFVGLSMSYAPQLVRQKDAETAGALMTFFLALGLSLGAIFTFPLRVLV